MDGDRYSARSLWRDRHAAALRKPCVGFEEALVKLSEGWRLYMIAVQFEHEGSSEDDEFLRGAWVRIGQGILDLLNGPTGRIDRGIMDAALREEFTFRGVEEVDSSPPAPLTPQGDSGVPSPRPLCTFELFRPFPAEGPPVGLCSVHALSRTRSALDCLDRAWTEHHPL